MAFLGNHKSPTVPTRSTICPHCGRDTMEPPAVKPKTPTPRTALPGDQRTELIRSIECLNHDALSSWETDFIDSISERLHNNQSLSDKQLNILERIIDEKS